MIDTSADAPPRGPLMRPVSVAADKSAPPLEPLIYVTFPAPAPPTPSPRPPPPPPPPGDKYIAARGAYTWRDHESSRVILKHLSLNGILTPEFVELLRL
ncbi:hypothetical protein JYU34_014840 [Plutella xylostella]|uniref:Uncharacterized protein n=1 Tax=Plutella xylostella TaxID=51655 RepID=A0ABQ7Q9A8_PLUXY|nr:hypothetical protein JYU34_014840 [Plutella xylostella]